MNRLINKPRTSGFTLTELLVALAIGMMVVQVAFSSFIMVQKFINRIQRMEAASKVLQGAIIWYIHNGDLSTYPVELTAPVGTDIGINIDNLVDGLPKIPLVLPEKPAPDGAVPRITDASHGLNATQISYIMNAPQRIMIGSIVNGPKEVRFKLYDFS